MNKTSKYEVIKLLGQGAFGKVFLVKDKETGVILCKKEIAVTKTNTMESIDKEVVAMKLLNCKYIVGFIDGFAEDKFEYYLYMEYCDGGDLFKEIEKAKKEGRKFTEDEIVRYFIKISLGLGYIHLNHMIHRDIKPQNIFLMKDKEVKIGDLGETRKINKGEKINEFKGTMCYMAPEIITGKDYDHKVDLWALGAMLFEMLTLDRLFPQNIPIQVMTAVNSFKEITQTFPDYPKPLEDIVKQIMKPVPAERPEIKTILKNDYLIQKSIELGLAADLSFFLGMKVGDQIVENEEIKHMQKFLIEDLGIPEKYFDFSQNNEDGGWAASVEEISGFKYKPPYGWYGIGLNIEELYPDEDDGEWIKPGRFHAEGAWPVAYHGLRGGKFSVGDKIKFILMEKGIVAGPSQTLQNDDDLLHPGQKCGIGAYHFLDINEVVRYKNVEPDEHGFIFVFMCRVNPENIRQSTRYPSFHLLDGNKDNTRPYRLLFRKTIVKGKK